MKMMTKILLLVAALAFGPLASAHQPLDVDCDVLAATNDAVNTFLDGEGIQFNSLGDLFSSALMDEVLFNNLRDLVALFSGGTIVFETMTQLISTNGRCGLTTQLIDHVRD